MPERKKPLRLMIGALLGATMICGLASGSVMAAEWPLVIPNGEFGNLPEGQGMSFFIDTWEQTSRFQGGGDMTVTVNTIEFRESEPEAQKYKVIHTAPNYILMVIKNPILEFSNNRFVPSGRYWTDFTIFTVQSFGRPVSRFHQLRVHSCTEPDIARSEVFDWSVEKLLSAFKKSRCLAEITFDGTANFSWSDSIFQRRGVWD